MLKNAFISFLEKSWKNRRSAGGGVPKPPSPPGSWRLRLQIPELLPPSPATVDFLCKFATLMCVLSKENKNSNSKCSAFCAYFISTSAVLLMGVQKHFCPLKQDTLATTLFQTIRIYRTVGPLGKVALSFRPTTR